ncbi:MAG: hypothetical protein ACKOC4_13635 [Planctomycetia bacterium]
MQVPCRGSSAAELAIVVAAPDDVAALEETLVSVLEHRPAGVEVVAALGCDYADPWNIRDEVRFVDAPRGAGLAACIQAGVAAARGRVIHVLAAGWRATAGWTEKPLAHFARGDVAAVVPLVVADADRERIVTAGIRTTRGGRRVVNGRGMPLDSAAGGRVARPTAPVLEAGFWSADLLAAGGGFPTACGDAFTDADMAAVIACTRSTVVLEPGSLVIGGAERDRPNAFTAGLHAEKLFWRSLAAGPVAPAVAAHAWEILRHAVVATPLGTVPMLAGRLWGLMQLGGHLARARQLAAVREQASEAAPTTLRIDDAHDGLAPPRRQVTPTPLRRSA